VHAARPSFHGLTNQTVLPRQPFGRDLRARVNEAALAHVRACSCSCPRVYLHFPTLCFQLNMRVIAALLCIVCKAGTVVANVEKTIFLGPSAVSLPDVRPSLEDLQLHALSSQAPILPTQLSVIFPSTSLPHGLESWYLLSGLEEGARYEVRICWPATVR
jgi:hypothetical protein